MSPIDLDWGDFGLGCFFAMDPLVLHCTANRTVRAGVGGRCSGEADGQAEDGTGVRRSSYRAKMLW